MTKANASLFSSDNIQTKKVRVVCSQKKFEVAIH
jgi:hypothetical protein